MTTKTKSDRFERFGKKLDNAVPKAEEELQKVIKFLNDKVVPEVRTHSSKALRTAATQLEKLAEYMEHHRKRESQEEHIAD